jgi:PAS domain S-box-containing protein
VPLIFSACTGWVLPKPKKSQIMNAIVSTTNDSERMQAAKEHFFDQALDMYGIAAANGNLRLVNPAWSQTLGWSDRELQSRPWIEFIHADDRDAVDKALMALSPGQRAHRIECRCQHQEGSYRWLWLNAMRSIDGSEFLASARDITDQKQNELREATRSLTLSALASGGSLSEVLGVLIKGVETEHSGAFSSVKLVDANRQSLHSGMAPSLPDFYNAVTERLPIGPSIGACGTAAFTRHRVVTFDIQTDPAWSAVKELAAKANLASCCSQPIYDRYGEVVGTVALYRSCPHSPTASEIATLEAAAQLAAIAIERKNQEQALQEGEARYRNIVETTTEGIWTVDETLRVTFVNKQLASMLGYQPDDMIGRGLFEFFDEETRESFAKRLEQRRLGISESYEFKIQHRKGHAVWVSISASPLMNASGKFCGAMAMLTDVTERRAAIVELDTKRNLLESITATSPDVMYLYDPQAQRHLYLNRDMKPLTGYSNDEILSGAVNLAQHFAHPDDISLLTQHMQKMTAIPSDEIVSIEYRIKLETDQVMWMQLRERVYSRDERGMPTVIFGIVQDITDRKYAEESLKERENYLVKIINNIGDPVFVKDDQSRFVLVNKAFCESFGRSRAEIIGTTMAEHLPVEQMENVLAVDRQVLDEGKDVVTEELVTRNGKTRFIYSRKTRYVDDEGNRFLIGLIHDFTEHKRLEDAIRSNESRLQEIFGAMAEGLVVQGLDGHIVESNPAAASILGINSEQLAGAKSINQDRRTIREDGSIFPLDSTPTMLVLQTKKAQRNTLMGIYRPDGSLVWISVNATPIHNQRGEMSGIVTSFSDVTASVTASASLKQSEASLSAAQSQAKIGSWELDLRTLAGSWSAELFRIFDRQPALGVPTRKEFAAMIHPNDRDAYDREFVRAVTEIDAMHVEFRIVLSDGSIRWLETRSNLIFDDQNFPVGMLGTTQDITERHQLEAQFRQAQKMEAIGTLAGGIAHDFNNILAAIKGYAQLAKTDVKENDEVHEYLDAVLQGTARATELVKQITTFSRQHDAQRTVLQLHTVVNEAMSLIRATIPTTIQISSKLDTHAPTILADTTQIHQVVMNLCTNAWHAMKAKPGRIDVLIDAVTIDAEFAKNHRDIEVGSYVRLSVVDTGMGMDTNTMSRIFEPFFTTKPPGEGSGLGLAVVHGIVRSHHGAVIVSSEPQRGTRFDLYFPVFQGEVDLPRAEPVVTFAPEGKGKRIVLIDDEPALIRLITQALTRLGYVVDSFLSSEAAVAALQAAPSTFDLLITDFSMPVLSGLDVVKALRQLRPNVPIIVSSGHIDESSQQQLHELGVSCLLLKPYSLNSMATSVNQLLKSSAKE